MVDVARELEVFKEELRGNSEFELLAVLESLQAAKCQAIVDIQRISSTRDLVGEARQYALADAHKDKELTRKKIQYLQDLIGKRRRIKNGISPPGFEYLKRFEKAAELVLPANLLRQVRDAARKLKSQGQSR